MIIIIKNLLNILKVLVDNTSPKQITWSLVLGIGLGISPFLSIQFFLILIVLLLFNIQFSLALSSSFFFKLLMSLPTSLFDYLGEAVLTNKSLQPYFEKMMNTPLIPYTNFNNTIVMGSFIVYIFSLPALYLITYFFVKRYQEIIVSKLKSTKIYLFIKSSFIVKWYEKYDRIYN